VNIKEKVLKAIDEKLEDAVRELENLEFNIEELRYEVKILNQEKQKILDF